LTCDAKSKGEASGTIKERTVGGKPQQRPKTGEQGKKTGRKWGQKGPERGAMAKTFLVVRS